MSNFFVPVHFFQSYWLNALTWALLWSIPIFVVLLYFLKLRRRPLEVPSTYLWAKTIEDLHVNSLWQRLRQNLLLFLQLLLLLFLLLACLNPGWRGQVLEGERFVFLLDTSASMRATDVEPSRLDEAKRRALELVDEMKSGDVAMIISFSNVARVEQSFTDNHGLLRQKIERIRPTNRVTDIGEALRAAAGLANPGQTSEAGNLDDVQVADALPATLFIFSDGGFPDLPSFSVGNLVPKYYPIGQLVGDRAIAGDDTGEETEAGGNGDGAGAADDGGERPSGPPNVGIVAFSATRNTEKPGQLQAFARLENHGADTVEVDVSLFIGTELLDAKSLTIPAHGEQGVEFQLEETDQTTLMLKVENPDSLTVDNAAFAVVNSARLARVLVVTPGNTALQRALSTTEAMKTANVSYAEPSVLTTESYQEQARAGAYDLIVYDQCAPDKLPQSNTLFIGERPPSEAWKTGKPQGPPIIIDTDRVHPLMQLIDLGNVRIVEAFSVEGPQGSVKLIDADIGSIFSAGPREGFVDAVMGFEIVHLTDDGGAELNTDWPIRRSFPVFVLNVLNYLGGRLGAVSTPSVQAGESVILRSSAPSAGLTVELPDGTRSETPRSGQNRYPFAKTEDLGIYRVYEPQEDAPSRYFAVNIFSSMESDLLSRDHVFIGDEVKGETGARQSRIDAWKWLLAAALVLLVFEWYVFNRRVYL